VTSLDAYRLLNPAAPVIDPDAHHHAAELAEALAGFATPRRGQPHRPSKGDPTVPRPNGRCRRCGAPVLLAVTAAGRLQPLNPQPDPAGNVAVYRNAAGSWRARVPNKALPALPYERIHMPHHATCKPPATVTPGPAQFPAGVVSLAEHRRKRRTP